jgi:ketosteroid isomerase-like protein
MSRENVEIISRLNAVFNRGDYDALTQFLHPEVEFVDQLPLPDVPQFGRGADEVRAVLEQWREGFTGFQAEVEEYIDLGNYVVCVTRWSFISRDEEIKLERRGAVAHELREGKVLWAAFGLRDKAAALEAVERRRQDAARSSRT